MSILHTLADRARAALVARTPDMMAPRYTPRDPECMDAASGRQGMPRMICVRDLPDLERRREAPGAIGLVLDDGGMYCRTWGDAGLCWVKT